MKTKLNLKTIYSSSQLQYEIVRMICKWQHILVVFLQTKQTIQLMATDRRFGLICSIGKIGAILSCSKSFFGPKTFVPVP
jgi:hypothetical protein